MIFPNGNVSISPYELSVGFGFFIYEKHDRMQG